MLYKVIIADDHPIIRHGAVSLFEKEKNNFKIVALTSGYPETLEKIQEFSPDLVIMDLLMQGDLCLELIKDIRKNHSKTKILLFSQFTELCFVQRVVHLGIQGIVLKTEPLETILSAVKGVMQGERYLSQDIKDCIVEQNLSLDFKNNEKQIERINEWEPMLNDREEEILYQVGSGNSNSVIAEKMHISVKTVESYKSRIKARLSLANSNILFMYATVLRDCFSDSKSRRQFMVNHD